MWEETKMEVLEPGGGAVGDEVVAGMICGVRVRAIALGKTSMVMVRASNFGSRSGCEEDDDAEDAAVVAAVKVLAGKG